MLKLILAGCAAIPLLIATNVYAQSDTPGDGRAAASKPATAQEKSDAKAKRRATSKEIAQGQGSTSTDNTVKTGKKATAEEKAAAKAKRKAVGADTAKKGSVGGETGTAK